MRRHSSFLSLSVANRVCEGRVQSVVMLRTGPSSFSRRIRTRGMRCSDVDGEGESLTRTVHGNRPHVHRMGAWLKTEVEKLGATYVCSRFPFLLSSSFAFALPRLTVFSLCRSSPLTSALPSNSSSPSPLPLCPSHTPPSSSSPYFRPLRID